MTNVMDYLQWRGDLLFTQDPPNVVDSLVFSTISYIRFEGRVKNDPGTPIKLSDAAQELLALEYCEKLGRNKNDMDLLRLAARTARFGDTKLCFYEDRLIPAQETQFAAITFLLGDGSACIAFRGTDDTLVGWKEDFNMCFQQTVPAQRMALRYVRDVFAELSCSLHLCGHSKGGNLAVFSAARSSPMVQQWILNVFNNDGPGFSDYLMGDPGYLAMVPKIHTFVPQSSIIGMIMDHEETYTVVRSAQLGILQHDTFSWEVLGNRLVSMENLTADSRYIQKTLKNWLSGMTREERNQFVDVLFDLLSTGNVTTASDIFRPRSIHNYIRSILGKDTDKRKILLEEFLALLEAAKQSFDQKEELLPEGEKN